MSCVPRITLLLLVALICLCQDKLTSAKSRLKNITSHSVVNIQVLARPGRHVCTSEKVISRPIPVVETYRKPVYNPRSRDCIDPTNCPQFDVKYELANRTSYRLQKSSSFQHSCCPGWTKAQQRGKGCMSAICTTGCGDFGVCVRPEVCECQSGYTGDMCDQDIDECHLPEHGCHQLCKNTAGSYMCTCREGFELGIDGKTCNYCFTCQKEYVEMMATMESLQKRFSQNIEKQMDLMTTNAAMATRLGDVEDKLQNVTFEKSKLQTTVSELQTSYVDAMLEIEYLTNITKATPPKPTQIVKQKTTTQKTTPTTTQETTLKTSSATTTPQTTSTTQPTSSSTSTTTPTSTTQSTTTTSTTQSTTTSTREVTTSGEEQLEFNVVDLIYSLSNQIGQMEEKLHLCRCQERQPYYS